MRFGDIFKHFRFAIAKLKYCEHNIAIMVLPKNLQPILWSVDINNLDLKKDNSYIINQILAYGTWQNLKWLFKNYPKAEIKEVFITKPQKDYLLQSFKFVSGFLLGLKSQNLKPEKYVKTFPRYIG